MKVRQVIGIVFIVTIIFSTVLGVLGIWEIIDAASTGKLVGTAFTLAVGLGAAGTLLDKFFGEGEIVRELIEITRKVETKEEVKK
jgi:hypothetical protein